MKKVLVILASMLMSLPASTEEYPNVTISGFGTIAGGQVLEGQGTFSNPAPIFLASYPNVSIYDENFSIIPESRLGVQATVNITESLSTTGQLVFRTNEDLKPEISWAYLSYELSDSLTFQLGRKRIPLFYYSDHYDIGYSYIWIRPPADVYTWQIQHFNGASISYKSHIKNKATLFLSAYAGRERDSNNKLLGEFFTSLKTEEDWENIVGAIAQIETKHVDFRASVMSYTNERYLTIKKSKEFQLKRDSFFSSLSLNLKYEGAELLTEFGRMSLDEYENLQGEYIETEMYTVSYAIGDFKPYISYSHFNQKEEKTKTLNQKVSTIDNGSIGEHHETRSVGIRWDMTYQSSLKLQYDNVNEKSVFNPVSGDSESITIALDFVW